MTYDETDWWKAILRHLMFLRRKCLELDPECKYSSYKTSNHLTSYRFPSVEFWGKFDIDTWVLGDIPFDEMVRFPAMCDPEEGNVCDGREGSHMVRRGSKGRSFLVNLGYLERVDLYEEVCIRNIGPDRFSMYLSGSYIPLSRYDVKEDIPLWYSMIPNVL
jgi:hypothetical protein